VVKYEALRLLYFRGFSLASFFVDGGTQTDVRGNGTFEPMVKASTASTVCVLNGRHIKISFKDVGFSLQTAKETWVRTRRME
jgi:hypothetical protein